MRKATICSSMRGSVRASRSTRRCRKTCCGSVRISCCPVAGSTKLSYMVIHRRKCRCGGETGSGSIPGRTRPVALRLPFWRARVARFLRQRGPAQTPSCHEERSLLGEGTAARYWETTRMNRVYPEIRIIAAAMVAILVLFLASAAPAAAQSALPGPSTPILDAPPPSEVTPSAPLPGAGPVFVDENYHLGTGDKVKVTVYGEDDLSGEFFVDGSGQIQLPLVGQVKAAGLTIHEFVNEVQTMLATKYLRDPKVSAQIEN